MVPGFSNQHLCNRDLTKVRVPKIRRHNPHDSRSPNKYLAKVRGKQRISYRSRTRGKPRPIGVPGPFLCRSDLPTTPRLEHKMRTGLPRGARCGLLSRLRGRPPAYHRRGRSPLNQPTRDHDDGATLGRRDANASQRPRRPVMRTRSGTTAATGTGPVSVSVIRIHER